MHKNEGIWRQVFDPENVGHYDELYNRISFEGVGRAEPKNYMLMPKTGFLIAQRYGVIVHMLDIRGSDTVFPLFGGPDDAKEPHQVVAISSGGFTYGSIFPLLKGCRPQERWRRCTTAVCQKPVLQVVVGDGNRHSRSR
ncbi:hypothetical protein HanRHA438_Chr03g0123121 [Helianthus annuus]|nr:hypothetical protein HanIR_Chr03g0121441 [Helianthus annuus]KAJ0935754.1 hypothetical protein HanRHA438_Chr03g0123121 [Helianthus annuus]